MPADELSCRETVLSWNGCPQKIVHGLLRWFQGNARPFPWRAHYLPYEIWISEMMLQQTQARRGWEYYERWMKRFPDIKTLAAAAEPEVLRLWQGLGYYSRARYILKTASMVMENYNGVFPRDRKTLLSLPGIGPYTASAIMSIAYNEPCCVMDGNVLRICARFMDISVPVDSAPLQKALEKILHQMLKYTSPRQFNQALMELGALVCTPRSPSCPLCPLQKECLGYQRNTVSSRPVKKTPPPAARIYNLTGIVKYENRFFLCKNPSRGLFANLWGFPAVESTEAPLQAEALEKMFARKYCMKIQVCRKITAFVHSYTRYKISLEGYLCQVFKKPAPENETSRWLSLEEMKKFPMPSAQNRIHAELNRQVELF